MLKAYFPPGFDRGAEPLGPRWRVLFWVLMRLWVDGDLILARGIRSQVPLNDARDSNASLCGDLKGLGFPFPRNDPGHFHIRRRCRAFYGLPLYLRQHQPMNALAD